MSARLAPGGQAWALARDGALWRSLDGGSQWQRTGQLPLAREDQMQAGGWWALDAQRLIVAGRADAAPPANTVQVSDDAGATWRASGFTSVFGVSPGGTMVGATATHLAALRDLGRSMVTLVPCAGTTNCLSFMPVGLFDDAALVVLADAPGSTSERPLRRRLSSSDGGSTWKAVDCALPRFLNSMGPFPGKTYGLGAGARRRRALGIRPAAGAVATRVVAPGPPHRPRTAASKRLSRTPSMPTPWCRPRPTSAG